MNRSALPRLPSDTALLVAEYVSGVLPADEHARVHALLAQDDVALAHALAWEETLLGLVDALPLARPDPSLRDRLQQTLGIGGPPAPQVPPSPQFLKRPSGPAFAHNDEQAALASVAQGDRAIREQRAATEAPSPRSTPAAPQQTIESDRLPDVNGTIPAAGRQPAAAIPPAVHDSPPRTKPVPNGHPVFATDSDSQKNQSARPQPAGLPPQDATPSGVPPSGKAAPTVSGSERALGRKLWIWRLVAVCATGAAIVGFVLPSEPPPAPIQVIKVAPTRAAILMAPGTTSTPGWTVTLDHEGNLLMQPLVHTQVDPGNQVLLWTRRETIPEPRLLGRIDPNRPVQVPASQLGIVADDQLFEITLETDEDARNGVAHGPILYIGQMTIFGSENALPGSVSQMSSTPPDSASEPESALK